MIVDCQGLGLPCSGEGHYRVFYTPDLSLNGGGWLCSVCVKILKDRGAIVIDRKEGQHRPDDYINKQVAG